MRKPTNMIQAQMKTNLVSTAATSSTGALVNATSAYNINDGEVQMLSSDINAADYGQLTATPDGKTAKLVQGTPVSNNTNAADPWGVSDPAIVESAHIYPKKVRNMVTANYSSGAYAVSSFTGNPTIVANETYGMIVELEGRRQDREYGQNTDQVAVVVDTPSTLPTSADDFVLQTLAVKLNQRSTLVKGNKRFVVLGINTGGGSGTALSALVNDNSAVNFMVQDGVTYTLQSSTPLVRGLAGIIAASSDITAASTIEVLDGSAAGNALVVDAIVVVGLDSPTAVYEDDVMQVRTDVTLNPSQAFESEGSVDKAYPQEAVNSGRKLSIENQNRAQLNIHTKQLTPYGEYFSQGYNYIDSSKNYGSFIVEFYDTESTVDHQYVYEKQATILWEQTEPITLSVDGVAAGTSAVLTFTPTETAPAVVGTFTTWVNSNS